MPTRLVQVVTMLFVLVGGTGLHAQQRAADFEAPEGLQVDFVAGGQRGWGGVFALDGVDRLCGLAYGFDLPPGWMPGSVLCGPERDIDASRGR